MERLTDERGKRVGPYRVWKREGNIPGLAMSRSIGDKIASEVGVISNPITNEFDLYAGHDQFLVMSSDGVWDVMENYEVVNFVERFRKQTISNPSTNSTTVRPNMTTISHLLAEEARYRWFGIIEEEDVMIDDISVLIIEMS